MNNELMNVSLGLKEEVRWLTEEVGGEQAVGLYCVSLGLKEEVKGAVGWTSGGGG